MSEIKHMPWSIRESATHITVINAKGDAVFHDDKRIDGVIKDASLIAAAPDLLEALQLCYDHCRLYFPEIEHNNVGETVRAVIAKALGEQS